MSHRKFATASAIAIVFASVGFLCALSGIDVWAAIHLNQDALPGDAKKLISSFEIFGHGAGVVVVALLVRVLDPDGLKRSIDVLISGFLPGLAVVGIKPFFERARPSKLIEVFGTEENALMTQWLVHFRWPAISFSDQSDNAQGFFHDAVHSFPSGHTATAFGLAWCLSGLYPRGSKLFWGFAAMVALQRVVARAHYPSDTFAGALVGLLFGFLVYRFRCGSDHSAHANTVHTSTQSKRSRKWRLESKNGPEISTAKISSAGRN